LVKQPYSEGRKSTGEDSKSVSEPKGSKVLCFVCNKPGHKAINCYFRGKVNVQTQLVKKGQIALGVIEETPNSAPVKTSKAAAMWR